MRLFITPGSPYARIARIMVIEKHLENQVEIVPAQTRTANSPYYQINPSGRVPFLVRADGVGLEESALICRYLDHLDGAQEFDPPPGELGWEAARLGAHASSLMDGIAVWGRELTRPPGERSPTIIRHETERAGRMIAWWETAIDHPLMRGPLSMVQIALGCALGLEARYPDFRWRDGHARLADWFAAIDTRPSFVATRPPAGH